MKRKKQLLSYILVMTIIISLFNGGNTLAYSYEEPVNEKETLSTISLEDGKQTEGKEFQQTELIQQTEAETEPAEQTETETETEPAEQTETETETEPAEQTETETVQQTEAETELIQQTETETEPAQQAETEPAEQTETQPAEQTETETEPAWQTEAKTEPIEQTEPARQTENGYQIYFRTGGNGKIVVDGQAKVDCLYENVLAGDEVPVPGVKASDGYQFKCWRKGSAGGETVELGTTVAGTTEDQTYYAIFEPKDITITFRVKNQEGATITAPGSNGSVKYEQIDDYTVKATYEYYKNTIVRYPVFKAEDGYTDTISATSNTYWWDETNGNRGDGSATISPVPTEDTEYSLIMGPVGNRQTKILYKAKDGSDIYSSTGRVFLNQTTEALSDDTIKKIEAKGYIVPEKMKGYRLAYDRANHVIMTDGEGQTIQEGVLDGNYFTFALEFSKAYRIETSANEFVTIDAGGIGEEGKDYTVNFTAQEGCTISRITVDGQDLSKEEIEALNGSYTFKALDGDHTIYVEAQKVYKVTFSAEKNGTLLQGETQQQTIAYEDVMEGTTVLVPSTKADPGYKFAGWTDSAGNVVELGQNLEVTADETYTAKFELEIPVAERNPKLDLTTRVTTDPNADGKYYSGDELTVEITVTNSGNLALKDIIVESVLVRPDGSKIVVLPEIQITDALEELLPGESKTIKYSYVITDKDLSGDAVIQTVTSGKVVFANPDQTVDEPDPEAGEELLIVTGEKEPETETEPATEPETETEPATEAESETETETEKETELETETETEKETQTETESETEKKVEKDDKKSVETGDDTPVVFYAVLMAVAALLIGFVIVRKAKKNMR